MRFSILAGFALLAALVHAHTTVYAVWVNEVDQGLGCGQQASGRQTGESVYIRCPPNNNPVKDLDSSAMACNVNNAVAPRWVTVKPGDKFTFEWHHDSRAASDDIIASSHKGPVLVYIAPAAYNGAGNVWVKLWQDAGTTANWAVDKLIAAKGRHYIYIPDVAPGKYLLKPEMLTLHEAEVTYKTNPARGMQYYTECIQIEVVGSGSTRLPAGVSFPGTYKYTDPAVNYNIYGGNLPAYQLPGPAVWSGYTRGGGYGGSGSATLAPGAPVQTQTQGSPGATPAPTGAAPGAGDPVAKWGQCGGNGWTGSTACVAGISCAKVNDYYSQCQ
ncbi:glycosyl hydrolase family 61-domain-containing protein [Tricharina praecox]|uniref:glycosyl hydrolase family 61-domain-containing protein n=1 Tax=Tricharina praecox TaxID=43433 RepID=UPI0022206CE5|nr:glycosyl hydrolase family 61-domain-containing protein [Tricharina praecox]KAI5858942.1 glycosyl hydrolase family 61-domain-containing protein [Tricharina praecox]